MDRINGRQKWRSLVCWKSLGRSKRFKFRSATFSAHEKEIETTCCLLERQIYIRTARMEWENCLLQDVHIRPDKSKWRIQYSSSIQTGIWARASEPEHTFLGLSALFVSENLNPNKLRRACSWALIRLSPINLGNEILIRHFSTCNSLQLDRSERLPSVAVSHDPRDKNWKTLNTH